jgi:hypothetical protein
MTHNAALRVGKRRERAMGTLRAQGFVFALL